jgi:transmembrane sensor
MAVTPNVDPKLLALAGEWDSHAGMQQYEPEEQHYQAAADWLCQLRERGVATEPAFEAWKAEHPAHAFAIAELDALFAGSGKPAHELRAELKASKAASKHRRWPIWATGIAACVALAALTPILPPLRYIGADYTSHTGEVRALRLADGSRVTLNSKSAIDADISSQARSTHLRGGEAFFEVAKDPARPFTVLADHAILKVLGTKFNVRMADDQTTISVVEGRVWVASRTHADQTVVLTRGHEALVDKSGLQIQNIRGGQVDAWRQHKLLFVATPVRVVIKELNRYRTMPIVLTNNALGNYKVTGVFSTQDTDSAVRSFERIIGASSYATPIGITLLY